MHISLVKRVQLLFGNGLINSLQLCTAGRVGEPNSYTND